MENRLNNIFDEYDILEDEPAEETYQAKSAYVREHFSDKMEMVGKKLRFTEDLLAMFRYFLDENVQWYRKMIIVGALAYFISPIDAIPDLTPLIGYLDDLGVIAAVVKFMGHELKPYYS